MNVKRLECFSPCGDVLWVCVEAGQKQMFK
jgi:hypothetical protein